MKFTVNWLKQYIDLEVSPAVIADHLTMLGLEVDAIEELFASLDTVKIAQITSVKAHPGADRLLLCEVDIGGEIKKIVCGAPNAVDGMYTAIALPGTRLPSGVEIRKSKIRGEISEGMLCSEKDLGISEDHSGIMELGDSLTPGDSLCDALGLKDVLIEVDLTPNRPDCTSVIGIAREIGGVLGAELRQPVETPLPQLTGDDIPFSIEVESEKDCPRYVARLLTDVKIAPSPWWLKRTLLAVGLRPINNVVDITNFVMLEYGQPLHAFDFDRIAGKKIIVRRAGNHRCITTLDGSKRDLEPEMLLICDAEKPVAVAGVMGGGNSEVSEATSQILLESACFDPVSIRRTSRKLNMGTDASYRFERGVDPELAPKAMARAVQLLVEIAGATVIDNGVDYCEGVRKVQPILLRVHKAMDLIGIEFTAAKIAEILGRIEISCEVIDDLSLQVIPPSFRVDLEREVDLIEEIARLVGYNNILSMLPAVPMAFPEAQKSRSLRAEISCQMVSQGFYEAINYSFVSPKHFDFLGLDKNDVLREAVPLLNPINEDQSVMRTTLLPGILENAARNINFQNTDLRLFEIGKVFLPSGEEQPDERQQLVALLSGKRYPAASVLHMGEDAVDVYDVKGVAEQLLDSLGRTNISFSSVSLPYIEEGCCLSIRTANQQVGILGKLHKNILKNFGIKQDVYFLELSLEVIEAVEREQIHFTPLPKYPSVRWDIAVVVPEETGVGEILSTIKTFDSPIIEDAEIFDVYRGKPIDVGKKSVAISICYRSGEKTLDDETVNAVHSKVTELILARFKGQLREE